MGYQKFLVIVFNLIIIVRAFNVSPMPNLIIKEPTIGRYLPKLRSSYFGYTLLLKHRSIFIGAPRAQSSTESQRNINETGLIYKCTLESGSSGHCVVYLIDKKGNEHSEDNEHTIDSKKKDFQWLGGSLDGGPKSSEPLIACAPRMKAETRNDYLMHGICYKISDTIDEQPTIIKTISPLKGTSQQIWENSFVYAFGQSGFSLHWTGEEDEILTGAPGIYDWKGSVIRYRAEEDKDLGGMQKRDVQIQYNLDENKKFVSSVPNPNLWNQPDFSYFGYSVSSGYFNVDSERKLLYVSSAPRANNYDGEVYIYDIIKDNKSKYYNIKKYQTFSGTQFGEFFGYTVVTEDINGDGHTDIIVSAPLYAKTNVYDCGAVYVYLSLGKNFIFDETVLQSPNQDPGRFGTSISLLGDINQDGYNDLAISAPFSENGKVYIYLGGKNGLNSKPSQTITAPNNENANGNHMFGHGLSKGLDIDGNGFNDFAIGAPNSDLVYLYKSYPIVKIFSTIDSTSREIQQDQKKLRIRVCFKMKTNSENPEKTANQDLRVKIDADTLLKRVRFNDGNYNLNDVINLRPEMNKCKEYETNIQFNLEDIFKPIEFKMSFELVHRVVNTEEFCGRCAALDPSHPNSMIYRIAFSTGCSNEICIADLNINSHGLSKTFVIGSSNIISIEYKVRNDGETAYLPQLNVTSSNNMPFAKVPSMCSVERNLLLCDLNQGQPMHTGKIDSITISFDASNIDVKYLEITAQVFSTGKEKNVIDNSVTDTIKMIEHSSVDVIRTNANEMITLDEKSGMHEFINKYEIRNNGPSIIKEATIKISVPLEYLIPKTTTFVTIISSENVTIKANYASYNLNPTYYEKGEVVNRKENNYGGNEASNMLYLPVSDSLDANKYDHSKFGYDPEHHNDDFNVDNDVHNFAMRKRRFSEFKPEIEINETEIKMSRITEEKLSGKISHELVGTLPINKVIEFQCNDPNESECVDIVMKVNNFRISVDRGINIDLRFIVNLDEINKVLIDEKIFFFISNVFNITRTGDESGESLDINKGTHYVIVSKYRISSTPIWVIVLSVLAGLILLAVMIFIMYKYGFFNRLKPNRDMTKTADLGATEPMLNSNNAEEIAT
ncbi:integrin alpha-PS3-like [Condylostylus longicornis]|uniref:integrin alpha-PS3-like n=1 Tax=Condylostylus longicornis TaxID=2530218 RepID=UPI00244E14B5|nr:integrin alpha-PS3-like [Condylostylus longicornis]